MIIVILIVLGLCMGSFINAIVWRLKTPNLSVLKGRSMCPKCQHQLAAKDLVPVFSWLYLKRKCRYCKKPISWQYPLVELLTTGLIVGSYLAWPTELNSYLLIQFISWLIMLVGLIALTVYDIKWMLLPDKIVFPLIATALLSLIGQFILGRPINNIYGIIWAVIIDGGIFWLIFQFSKGKWIGGGDVKLGFLLGLIVGKPEYAFLTLFIASVIATLFSLPLLMLKKLKKTSKIPFGPFLIAACMIVVLFGATIIDAYKSVFSQ